MNYTTIAIDGTPTEAQLERATKAGYTLLQRGDEYYFIKDSLQEDVDAGTHKTRLRAPDERPGFEWHESYYARGVRKVFAHRIENGEGYTQPVSEEVTRVV